MRGNDARFINHGCDPNLEVRKYQTMGDGWEEFEIGMWAIKDIKAGDEASHHKTQSLHRKLT
jgi:SET domain-containing protein